MMTSDDIFHSAHPHLLLLSATLLCHSQCLCRGSLASHFEISPQLQKNLLENPTKQQIKLFET
jgi:hypothetical protein